MIQIKTKYYKRTLWQWILRKPKITRKPEIYIYESGTTHPKEFYTDNTKDDNFYVYAAKDNTEKVLIHTIYNWEDPHTNAIIHVLDTGIVHVHVSARGNGNK